MQVCWANNSIEVVVKLSSQWLVVERKKMATLLFLVRKKEHELKENIDEHECAVREFMQCVE